MDFYCENDVIANVLRVVFSDSEDADFLESGKAKQLNPCAPVFYPCESKEIPEAQYEKSKNSELNISKEKQMVPSLKVKINNDVLRK